MGSQEVAIPVQVDIVTVITPLIFPNFRSRRNDEINLVLLTDSTTFSLLHYYCKKLPEF